MTTIFKEVEEGHGRGREFMYICNFEFAFEKVQSNECTGENLSWGGRRGRVRVQVATPKEGEDIDKERTGIFDNEDCSPGYLASYSIDIRR